MIPNQPYRISGGQVALGVVLALLLGTLTPLLTVLEACLLLPVAALGGVFMVFLYCYAGRLPAFLFMAVQLASASTLLGADCMWMLLAAGCVPGILSVRGVLLRRPFFDQMKRSMLLYGAGMLAALLIAWTRLGSGMIGRATEALLKQFERMPDAFFEPFVETLNGALGSAGIAGLKRFTVASYREQIAGVLSLAKQTYEEGLPGALISGAALSGVLSTLWGSWLLARRGLATEQSYVGLTRWFLPAEVTGGLMLMWVAAFVMARVGYASGESVNVAAYDMVNLAFYIQALAAIDRFFYRRGVGDRGRRVRVILAMLLGGLIPLAGLGMFMIGASSALFGSHGAIRSVRRRDNDDHTD